MLVGIAQEVRVFDGGRTSDAEIADAVVWDIIEHDVCFFAVFLALLGVDLVEPVEPG